MKPILLLYATREGQTRRVAEHLRSKLADHGFAAEVYDARTVHADLDLTGYSAAILAASVHVGKHEPEMIAFVKAHRTSLERLPTAFLSVSGAEASVEDEGTRADTRVEAARDVQTAIDRFMHDTNWHPQRAVPVAGAMLFTQYNVFVRFIIRRIAKSRGGNIDPTRDREYTDWAALDRFVAEFTSGLESRAPSLAL